MKWDSFFKGIILIHYTGPFPFHVSKTTIAYNTRFQNFNSKIPPRNKNKEAVEKLG